jgi:hypothetical protein
VADVDRTIRPIVILLYVNLGISVLLAVLTVVLKNSMLDYQFQHLLSAGKIVPGHEAATRSSLEITLWTRPVSVLVVSVVYVRLAARLHLGRRRTYIRLLAIAILGTAGLAYLILTAGFPVWYRIIQVVQGLVLLSLLAVLSKKDIRGHFAPKPQPVKISD